MSGRGRVCLHAGYLYPLFSGGTVEFAGGAEVQQALIARGLAARGFEVSVVTCDYGQPPELVADGVRLLRSHPPRGGIPVLRFFHPRLSRAARVGGRRRRGLLRARPRGAGGRGLRGGALAPR